VAPAPPALDASSLRARAAVLRGMRAWFDARGYLELPTPALVPSPALEPTLIAVPADGRFLRTSPEMAMKRALAAGLGRVYQIGPAFRAEEQGPHHSLEFTLAEWYRVGAGLEDLITDTIDLIGDCAAALGLPRPRFVRRSVDALMGPGAPAEPVEWFRRWVEHVDPQLVGPTIVTGWPAWQAALARQVGDQAARFEVYLGGLELANAYDEELDPAVLSARWDASDAWRAAEGRPPHPRDPAFLEAVGRMPRCAGIALGVDRLVMALTGAPDIARVQVR